MATSMAVNLRLYLRVADRGGREGVFRREFRRGVGGDNQPRAKTQQCSPRLLVLGDSTGKDGFKVLGDSRGEDEL